MMCCCFPLKLPSLWFLVQGSAKRWTLGFVNPCSWLPLTAGRKFTQPRAHLLADPCTRNHKDGSFSGKHQHIIAGNENEFPLSRLQEFCIRIKPHLKGKVHQSGMVPRWIGETNQELLTSCLPNLYEEETSCFCFWWHLWLSAPHWRGEDRVRINSFRCQY